MEDLSNAYVIDGGMIFTYIFIGLFLLNISFVFTIIFMERRSAGSIWAWILVLSLFPILGFILYLLFGRQIQRKSIFKVSEKDQKGLAQLVNQQLEALKNDHFDPDNPHVKNYKSMIRGLLYNNAAFYTNQNKIDVLLDGNQKFNQLKADILNAKSYIHIQYY
ncbi:cardiolipin synthase, partial [Staphylococcus hyicus]